MNALRIRYNYGALFHVNGKLYALIDDQQDEGPWGVIAVTGKFVPPIEPIPGLGYAVTPLAEYPRDLEEFWTDFEETENRVSFLDVNGSRLTLFKDTRLWQAL